MADYSKNITNSVRVFGIGPSTKWGQASAPTMVWGTSKWGEGTTPMRFTVVHYISNSQALAFDRSQGNLNKVFGMGSISVAADMSLERLQSGQWDVVFVSDTTNAETRTFASWTAGNAASGSFTSLSVPSTTWS